MNNHIEELAELYSLGMLSPKERAAVDAHLVRCAPCSMRIGESEAVIAALAERALPTESAPPRLGERLLKSAAARAQARPMWSSVRVLIGVAAALILGLGLSVLQVSRENQALRVALNGDERAFSALTHSHFRHAEFSRVMADSPSAKVIYARDGSWFYVVVDGARRDLHVLAKRDGATHDYGLAKVHGHTTTLFVDRANRATMLELQQGSSVIGVATPQY